MSVTNREKKEVLLQMMVKELERLTALPIENSSREYIEKMRVEDLDQALAFVEKRIATENQKKADRAGNILMTIVWVGAIAIGLFVFTGVAGLLWFGVQQILALFK